MGWLWGSHGAAMGQPRGADGAVAALKDERFQLAEFTPRQLRMVLNRARLDDEGGYFCQLYTDDTHHQIATLTVLGMGGAAGVVGGVEGGCGGVGGG